MGRHVQCTVAQLLASCPPAFLATSLCLLVGSQCYGVVQVIADEPLLTEGLPWTLSARAAPAPPASCWHHIPALLIPLELPNRRHNLPRVTTFSTLACACYA